MAINYDKRASGVCKGCSNWVGLDDGWLCLLNNIRLTDMSNVVSCQNKENASPYILPNQPDQKEEDKKCERCYGVGKIYGRNIYNGARCPDCTQPDRKEERE